MKNDGVRDAIKSAIEHVRGLDSDRINDAVEAWKRRNPDHEEHLPAIVKHLRRFARYAEIQPHAADALLTHAYSKARSSKSRK